jgi:hypothetical protein
MSHRAAAVQYGKGDDAEGMKYSKNAQQHSRNASKQTEQACVKSQLQK